MHVGEGEREDRLKTLIFDGSAATLMELVKLYQSSKLLVVLSYFQMFIQSSAFISSDIQSLLLGYKVIPKTLQNGSNGCHH